MASSKPWYKSKLVWLGVLEIVRGTMAVQPGDGLDLSKVDWQSFTFGVVTIILRFVTEHPIK